MQMAYETIEARTAHIQRNIRAVLIKYPEWMDPELAKALAAIIERHTIRIDGLRSGFNIQRLKVSPFTITKTLAFEEIDFTIPELSNCEISQALNAWVDGAMKAQTKGIESFNSDVERGLTVVFYELNPTHTHAVRVWQLDELFPKDTGVLAAYQDLHDGKLRDAPLDDCGSYIRPIFEFGDTSSYNNEATKELVKGIIQNGAPSTQGYAEPMRPGDVYVFSVDEHDPDPVQTIDFIKRQVQNQGVNVVILDPNVAEMLQSDEPIDFEKLKAACIKPPAEWEGTVSPEELEKAAAELQNDDLKLRELRLGTDSALNQSLYWNYMRELSNSVAAHCEDSIEWAHGGNIVKMPKETPEALHMKLDEIGIPSAQQLRDQGWQPPAFPKQLDPLQSGECEIQNRRRADNFPDVLESNAPDFVANIQIPQSLQHATEEHAKRIGDASPYGTGYQSTPAPTSQLGNEIPEGWKAPSVDIDTRADSNSNDDSGSTQSSD